MSAVLSPCGRYRYRLDRQLTMGDGPTYAFFGVNPSTADASVDDATVRKWTGFCRRWGASRYVVANVFAYRSTDVRELANAGDPIGQENGAHLRQVMRVADILVPCWGSTAKVPDRLRGDFGFVLATLAQTGKPLYCFGLTKDGDPKHPLMLGYDTQLIDIGQPGAKGGEHAG